MKKQDVLLENAAQMAINKIVEKFPNILINMIEIEDVEFLWIIPEQQSVKHEISLYLDYDELYFSVGNFLMSIFPCTDVDENNIFIDRVCGFLDGKYRIIEYYRRQECIKADLQIPIDKEWKTVASWGKLHWPFPREKTHKIITNKK